MIVQRRDAESGLQISDRFFQPISGQKTHHFFWIVLNTVLLACLSLGLLRLVTTGFGVTPLPWLYPAALGLCLFAAILFQSEWCMRIWPGLAVVLLLGYMGTLFYFQTDFLQGMQQFINLAVVRLNETYSGSLGLPFQTGGKGNVNLFLGLMTIPVVFWLAISLLRSNIALMMELLIFPSAAALLLCGAAEDAMGKFLLLFGFLLALSFTRTKRQKRMWGGRRRELLRQNTLRFQSVQKKSALGVLVLCVVLSVPGFLLIRPLLALSLQPARVYSSELQTDALNQVMKLLPELTAGQWNLNVETVSGGVQDGSIIGRDGYLLEGVEDLRLTLTQKPEESLFLRGYVGAVYEDGSWNPAHAYTFDGAAINWNTEGSPRLYIQNLPFLRTAFSLNQRDSAQPGIAETMAPVYAAPVQMSVERINANPGYTYVPYGAYLNDYYEIEAGDGSVSGQKEQEDRYFFFFHSDMEAVLAAWNTIEDTANVLDRVEESYRAFCNTAFSAVPEGLEELQAEVDAIKSENRWQLPRDADEISAWIRHYLAQNYSYSLMPPEVPEGEDALHYFLSESRTGNSVHFASAAVVLYRMFGLPARYVVGYEVPAALFTVQAGGVYTATVQGDNSQAWAEIYLPGIGWSPRDMTPGVIGTLEEVGPGGIRVEMPAEEPSEETLATEEIEIPTETVPAEPEPAAPSMTFEEVIHALGIAAAAIVTILLLWGLTHRITRDLGLLPLGYRGRKTRLLGVFQAIFRRARRLKLPKGIDSQSEAFLTFLQSELRRRAPETEKLAEPAIATLYAVLYGGAPVRKSDIDQMRKILLSLYRHAKQ